MMRILAKACGRRATTQGSFAYVGPCEPRGVIPYVVRLYALDVKPDLKADADRNALFAAMNGHILDVAEIAFVHDRQYGAAPPSLPPPGVPARHRK